MAQKGREHVKAGEVLLEVATDKATVEYEALDDGWIRKILVHEREEAPVNHRCHSDSRRKRGIENVKLELPKKSPLNPARGLFIGNDLRTSSHIPWLAQPTFAPEPPLSNYRFHTIRSRSGTHNRLSTGP